MQSANVADLVPKFIVMATSFQQSERECQIVHLRMSVTLYNFVKICPVDSWIIGLQWYH